jgi:hypothetical protein
MVSLDNRAARPRKALLPAALLAILALSGAARADGPAPAIRTGTFCGRWHGDNARFTITLARADGSFEGEAELTSGDWTGYRFEIIGRTERGGRLTVIRVIPNDGAQVAETSPPRRDGRTWAWRGTVRGTGVPRAMPFELRMPQ